MPRRKTARPGGMPMRRERRSNCARMTHWPSNFQESSPWGPAMDPIEQPLLAQIEQRLALLEQMRFEGPQPNAPGQQGTNAALQRGRTGAEATLLLAGPARAVVRLAGQEQDVHYRLPFEAKMDGPNCIKTVKAIHGIGAGERICRASGRPWSPVNQVSAHRADLLLSQP